MAKIMVKYRKRKRPIKDALQWAAEAGTYEGAVKQFKETHSWAEYQVVSPEERAGEYFVGNISEIGQQKEERALKEHKIPYRIGKQAYDINGRPLSSWHHPLFIRQSDLKQYDQMMKNRT